MVLNGCLCLIFKNFLNIIKNSGFYARFFSFLLLMLQVELRASCMTSLYSTANMHSHFKLPPLNCTMRWNGTTVFIPVSGHGASRINTWATSFCSSASFSYAHVPCTVWYLQWSYCCCLGWWFCLLLGCVGNLCSHHSPYSWQLCDCVTVTDYCANDCVLVVGRKRVTWGRQILQGPFLYP